MDFSDRLIRRLGAGRAGEVFEAVIGGKVFALKLFTDHEKLRAEHAAYTTLHHAIANLQSHTTTTIASSFCRFHGTYAAVAALLRDNSRRATPCGLAHGEGEYCPVGLVLDMLDGPTLDDSRDRGTGAVTTVLRTEGQRRRVWERLGEALAWLHGEAGLLHGSVHGRNVVLVRVGERMGREGDGEGERERGEEDGGGEEEEEDYMPVLIDFNHAERKEDFATHQDWLVICMAEFDELDRLLPMVALKDMVASQGRLISSHGEGKEERVSVCGTCSTCLNRRVNRLVDTLEGLWRPDHCKYAGGNEEIVQPMLADALHVVTVILQDIERTTERWCGFIRLKARAEKTAKWLLWRVLDNLPCAGDEVLRTFYDT